MGSQEVSELLKGAALPGSAIEVCGLGEVERDPLTEPIGVAEEL
tara:strand:+ start:613 stop:744 length:132 start_codon:yes stop_codon:yes gene_type:complete